MRVPPNHPGFMRKVYPGFLQHASFLAMNPDRHADAHQQFYNHLIRGDGENAEAHRKFYDEYNAVLDMPAEYYLDTVKVVFQEFQLPKGKMGGARRAGEAGVDPKTALFTIEGELDDISGNGQTEAAQTLCRNIPSDKRRHLMAKGVGHYGIFSGRKFREMIYPQIRSFIHLISQSEADLKLVRIEVARGVTGGALSLVHLATFAIELPSIPNAGADQGWCVCAPLAVIRVFA